CRPVQRDGGACHNQGSAGQVRPEAPSRDPLWNQRDDEIDVHEVLDPEYEHRATEEDAAERPENAIRRHVASRLRPGRRPVKDHFLEGGCGHWHTIEGPLARPARPIAADALRSTGCETPSRVG